MNDRKVFMMKSRRQEEILRIIENEDIETQEDLANELRSRGYTVTQATVSRDIKELHLIKVAGRSSTYCYALPGRQESAVKVLFEVSNLPFVASPTAFMLPV